ncbi:hypothetical protein U1Q18_025026 [Sarracenia purpurea var. burkii]
MGAVLLNRGLGIQLGLHEIRYYSIIIELSKGNGRYYLMNKDKHQIVLDLMGSDKGHMEDSVVIEGNWQFGPDAHWNHCSTRPGHPDIQAPSPCVFFLSFICAFQSSNTCFVFYSPDKNCNTTLDKDPIDIK